MEWTERARVKTCSPFQCVHAGHHRACSSQGERSLPQTLNRPAHLVVRSLLQNAAAVDHSNDVGIPHRGQPARELEGVGNWGSRGRCCAGKAHRVPAGRLSGQAWAAAWAQTWCWPPPVSHHHRGAPHHQPVQRLLHHLLALGIQRRGGLVQQQDLGGRGGGGGGGGGGSQRNGSRQQPTAGRAAAKLWAAGRPERQGGGQEQRFVCPPWGP
jgi:hypothetical protein